jgi:PAS domain S-box-containing protein
MIEGTARPSRRGRRSSPRIVSATATDATVSNLEPLGHGFAQAGPVEGLDLATLELLPDGIVVADHKGDVVAINAAAGKITGLDQDEWVGRQLAAVLPLVDDEGRSWWTHTHPFEGIRTRTRQPERLLWVSGRQPVFVTAAYVRPLGSNTSLRYLVVSIRPATDRTRLERRGAELVAMAAHELRSPLTSIKGFTTTLLTKWSRFTDDQRRLMLETVEADADRLTRLIVDLLDVARLDSGQVRLHRSWVDVESRVRHAIVVLVAGGADPSRFSVEVDGPIPRVWADADKIDQICLNLLENAIRHGDGIASVVLSSGILGTPPGDEPGAVSRPYGAVAGLDDVDGGGPAVTVAVSDEGSGIPEHLVARAFHKFWHTGGAGTGLGLYLVRGMVEAHGGTIGVDRGPGGGARFRFRLPVGSPDPTG